MSDVHLFTEIPLELVLKSQKLKIQLKGDSMGEVCSEGLDECALYLNIYINDALTAKTESDAVKAICHAYQKTASTKYYIRLLRDNNCISDTEANDLLSDCRIIRNIIEPVVEKYRGEYDGMDEDELNECRQMLRDAFPYLFFDDEDEA